MVKVSCFSNSVPGKNVPTPDFLICELNLLAAVARLPEWCLEDQCQYKLAYTNCTEKQCKRGVVKQQFHKIYRLLLPHLPSLHLCRWIVDPKPSAIPSLVGHSKDWPGGRIQGALLRQASSPVRRVGVVRARASTWRPVEAKQNEAKVDSRKWGRGGFWGGAWLSRCPFLGDSGVNCQCQVPYVIDDTRPWGDPLGIHSRPSIG